MDPFTLALATFGVQKLRGKSTKRALRDAAIIGGGSYALGAAGVGGSTFTGAPLSSAKNFLGMGQTTSGLPQLPFEATQGAQFRNPGYQKALSVGAETPQEPGGITKLLTKAKKNPLETALIASSVIPLLEGEGEDPKPVFTEEDYKQAYKEQSGKLEGAFQPVENAMPSRQEVFGSNMFYANSGGLATAIPKYNQGGINYLPSKIDHNENDVNNYVRAEGYVEDGAGAGDKDEDTMLAQLADGEFVSRADAVLGAGILSGADPKSFKGMRKAGADFFYDQQKKFKRIYDIVNASKPN
tara:strand:- start:524 stop:1417 length:894 start_codon:yes stop_codon:yes gene_type:complete